MMSFIQLSPNWNSPLDYKHHRCHSKIPGSYSMCFRFTYFVTPHQSFFLFFSFPPCQHLFGLIRQDDVLCFHHDSKSWCDSGLQQPFHSLVNKVLLVLTRKNASYVYMCVCDMSCSVCWIISLGLTFTFFSYFGVLLRHMLFWKLGQLNQLRENFFLFIGVSAVNQDASNCI